LTVTIPGLGVATPLTDLLVNYRALVRHLPRIIEQHPTARAVRNRVGNLSIVVDGPDGVQVWGWIDVRTGDVALDDEPAELAPFVPTYEVLSGEEFEGR
jgi:hypothetical protein